MGAFLGVSLLAYSEELGINEILNRVEIENPGVKVEDLEIKIKEKQKLRAFKNLVLPPVNFSTEEDWELIKDEGIGFNKIEAYIPLYQGGKIYNSYKKSISSYDLSKEERDLNVYSWQELSIGEYFKVLNYRKQREITKNTIEALEKQKSRLLGLYNEGKMIPKSELLKVDADIENNKAVNMKNLQRELNSRENLMQMLNYSLDSTIKLKEFNAENYLKSLGEIKKSENPKNTTLGKKEELLVDLANYDLKIAKGDLYPTIYIKPSHEFKEEINGEYKTINEGRVEVGITYRFEWGGTLDKVSEKEYALEQANIKYDNNIKGIDLDMRNKLREIESLTGQSLAQKKRVELLNENLNIDTLRYDNELVTTFDYLNSVNQLREAHEDFYILQRELVLAVVQYNNLYK